MLSGHFPFSHKNERQLMKQILTEDVVFKPEWFGHISQEAQQLITRMLKKHPDDRINIKYVLSNAWFKKCVDN
jgi:serine/threonine protein kinase